MKPVHASELGIDIAAVEHQLDALRGLPVHMYSDPKVYDFEIAAIFERTWQYFCPIEKVRNPGDVVTGVVGRTPVVVTRTEDGQLHGLVNICPHRAYTVAVGEEKGCKLLMCKYHAWSFRLDGSLLRAPDTEDDKTFDKAAHGLLPVSVDTFAQAVFVNVDPEAIPLREAFPNLGPWAKEIGFNEDPDFCMLQREYVIDQNCNWKLWYDNGVECYHCPTIHGATFAEAFGMNDRAYTTRLEDGIMNWAFEEPKSKDRSPWSSGYRSFQIFPGCHYVQLDDVVVTGKITPTGPASCRFTAYYSLVKGGNRQRAEDWIDLWHQTFCEDAKVVETQQLNLFSSRMQPFRYVAKREAAAMFFLRETWNQMKANLIDDGPGRFVRAAE